jgi:hypothetical protein
MGRWGNDALRRDAAWGRVRACSGEPRLGIPRPVHNAQPRSPAAHWQGARPRTRCSGIGGLLPNLHPLGLPKHPPRSGTTRGLHPHPCCAPPAQSPAQHGPPWLQGGRGPGLRRGGLSSCGRRASGLGALTHVLGSRDQSARCASTRRRLGSRRLAGSRRPDGRRGFRVAPKPEIPRLARSLAHDPAYKRPRTPARPHAPPDAQHANAHGSPTHKRCRSSA